MIANEDGKRRSAEWLNSGYGNFYDFNLVAFKQAFDNTIQKLVNGTV